MSFPCIDDRKIGKQIQGWNWGWYQISKKPLVPTHWFISWWPISALLCLFYSWLGQSIPNWIAKDSSRPTRSKLVSGLSFTLNSLSISMMWSWRRCSLRILSSCRSFAIRSCRSRAISLRAAMHLSSCAWHISVSSNVICNVCYAASDSDAISLDSYNILSSFISLSIWHRRSKTSIASCCCHPEKEWQSLPSVHGRICNSDMLDGSCSKSNSFVLSRRQNEMSYHLSFSRRLYACHYVADLSGLNHDDITIAARILYIVDIVTLNCTVSRALTVKHLVKHIWIKGPAGQPDDKLNQSTLRLCLEGHLDKLILNHHVIRSHIVAQNSTMPTIVPPLFLA